MKNKKKIEIMAPAGSFASLSAAINAGCNSVYFGVEQLNMRARASYNFKTEDLTEIAKRAKKAGIKTYIALNTVLYEHDMNLMREIISKAKKAGINAIIAADIAAITYAHKIKMPVHISTQLSISNYEGVKFYSKFADTIVLAREVDIKMMKIICDKIKKEKLTGPSGKLIKIEVFAHGALCIAQSGRCNMSILQTNTSAQRGACLQECRKKYRVTDDETGRELILENGYILSPKDLCTIEFMDKLIETGVSVLKIEGRGRSPQYVDTVTRCYREAADSIEQNSYCREKIKNWMSRLKTVYNRGLCDGYYLGRPLPEWSGAYGSRAKEERIFVGLINHYFNKAKIAEIKLQAHPLKMGDKIVVIGETTGVIYEKIKSIMDEKEKLKIAEHPRTVTIPINDRVRKNDRVFVLQKRNLSEKDQIKRSSEK